MTRNLIILLALLTLGYAAPSFAQNSVTVRIKDISHLKNEVDATLTGTGLVTGLNGTGDDQSKGTYTANYNYQQNIRRRKDAKPEEFKSSSVGVVNIALKVGKSVTTATGGLRAVVTVFDETTSLVDGSLVKSELVMGPGGKTMAIASGQLRVDPESPRTGYVDATLIQDLDIKNYDTETDTNGNSRKYVTLVLDKADDTTQTEVIRAINEMASRLGEVGTAVPEGEDFQEAEPIAFEMGRGDAIKVYVPSSFDKSVSAFIAQIHAVEVNPDIAAQILIDEDNDQVLWNGNVRISGGNVKVGNVIITVPPAGVIPGQPMPGDEINGPAIPVGGVTNSVTMQEFVDALNVLGLDAKATAALFRNMKTQGMLHGKIVEPNK